MDEKGKEKRKKETEEAIYGHWDSDSIIVLTGRSRFSFNSHSQQIFIITGPGRTGITTSSHQLMMSSLTELANILKNDSE